MLKLWGITGPKSAQMYCKMGGRGEPRNSKNLPRWAAEFGKWCRGIWQNLPRKTVGPINHVRCVNLGGRSVWQTSAWSSVNLLSHWPSTSVYNTAGARHHVARVSQRQRRLVLRLTGRWIKRYITIH